MTFLVWLSSTPSLPRNSILIAPPNHHLCVQLPRRGKLNHSNQNCLTFCLCYYLLGVAAYFMLSTGQNRQRVSPRLLLLVMSSVDKPFTSSSSDIIPSGLLMDDLINYNSSTVVAMVIKARAPTSTSHVCITTTSHLRHWRWLIISLIFFYGLVSAVAPVRALATGSGLRISSQPNGTKILARSLRSTWSYRHPLDSGFGFLHLLDEVTEQKFYIGINDNGTLEITKDATCKLGQIEANCSVLCHFFEPRISPNFMFKL